MRFTADIGLNPQIIAQIVDEACAPIARIDIGIMHRDHDFKLGRAGLADTLDRLEFVRMGRASSVEEGLFVEADSLNDQRIAFYAADGMAIVRRMGDDLLVFRQWLAHPDHAVLMVELMQYGHVAGRAI